MKATHRKPPSWPDRRLADLPRTRLLPVMLARDFLRAWMWHTHCVRVLAHMCMHTPVCARAHAHLDAVLFELPDRRRPLTPFRRPEDERRPEGDDWRSSFRLRVVRPALLVPRRAPPRAVGLVVATSASLSSSDEEDVASRSRVVRQKLVRRPALAARAAAAGAAAEGAAAAGAGGGAAAKGVPEGDSAKAGAAGAAAAGESGGAGSAGVAAEGAGGGEGLRVWSVPLLSWLVPRGARLLHAGGAGDLCLMATMLYCLLKARSLRCSRRSEWTLARGPEPA